MAPEAELGGFVAHISKLATGFGDVDSSGKRATSSLGQFGLLTHSVGRSIVSLTGALKGMSGALRISVTASDAFRKTFESSFKTIGELENSIFLTSQRIYGLSSAFKSAGSAQKSYEKSITDIKNATKLYRSEAQALFGSVIQNMQGMRTQSAIDGFKGITIAVANMSNSFDEAKRQMDLLSGVMNKYSQIRRGIEKATAGDADAAKGVQKMAGGLLAAGLVSDEQATAMVNATRYVQRPDVGPTGITSQNRELADQYYRYRQYGMERELTQAEYTARDPAARAVMEKAQLYDTRMMERPEALGGAMAAAGRLDLTNKAISEVSGIAGRIAGPFALGGILRGGRGGGAGGGLAKGVSGGAGMVNDATKVYVTNMGGGMLDSPEKAVSETAKMGIFASLLKGGGKTLLKSIPLVGLGMAGYAGANYLAGGNLFGKAKESVSGLLFGRTKPEREVADLGSKETAKSIIGGGLVEDAEEIAQAMKDWSGEAHNVVPSIQQIKLDTGLIKETSEKIAGAFGDIASVSWSVVRDASRTAEAYGQQEKHFLEMIPYYREQASLLLEQARTEENTDRKRVLMAGARVNEAAAYSAEVKSIEAGMKGLTIELERGLELQQLNTETSEVLKNLHTEIRLGIGVSYQDTLKVVGAMSEELKIQKQLVNVWRGKASETGDAVLQQRYLEKAQRAQVEALKKEKDIYSELRSIREGYLSALQVRVFGTGGFAKLMPSRDEGVQHMAPAAPIGASMKGFGGEIGEPGRYTTGGMKFPSGTDAYTQQYRKMFGGYGEKGGVGPWVFGMGDEAGYGQEVMRGDMKNLSTSSVKQSASMEKMANALVSAKQPGSPLYVIPVGGSGGGKGYRPLSSAGEEAPEKALTPRQKKEEVEKARRAQSMEKRDTLVSQIEKDEIELKERMEQRVAAGQRMPVLEKVIRAYNENRKTLGEAPDMPMFSGGRPESVERAARQSEKGRLLSPLGWWWKAKDFVRGKGVDPEAQAARIEELKGIKGLMSEKEGKEIRQIYDRLVENKEQLRVGDKFFREGESGPGMPGYQPKSKSPQQIQATLDEMERRKNEPSSAEIWRMEDDIKARRAALDAKRQQLTGQIDTEIKIKVGFTADAKEWLEVNSEGGGNTVILENSGH